MRKLIVCNIVSLDGYYEGPGKDVMALPFDEAFDDYNAERLRAADPLLLGRRSFEGFKSYWPPVADRSDARPVEREISRLNSAIDKVVISDSLTESPWDNAEVAGGDLAETIGELKARPGRDIITYGGSTLVRDLIGRGLLDELNLFVNPAAIGTGLPVFPDAEERVALRLVEARAFACGITGLRYAPARA